MAVVVWRVYHKRTGHKHFTWVKRKSFALTRIGVCVFWLHQKKDLRNQNIKESTFSSSSIRRLKLIQEWGFNPSISCWSHTSLGAYESSALCSNLNTNSHRKSQQLAKNKSWRKSTNGRKQVCHLCAKWAQGNDIPRTGYQDAIIKSTSLLTRPSWFGPVHLRPALNSWRCTHPSFLRPPTPQSPGPTRHPGRCGYGHPASTQHEGCERNGHRYMCPLCHVGSSWIPASLAAHRKFERAQQWSTTCSVEHNEQQRNNCNAKRWMIRMGMCSSCRPFSNSIQHEWVGSWHRPYIPAASWSWRLGRNGNPSLSDPLPSLLSLASEGKVKAVQWVLDPQMCQDALIKGWGVAGSRKGHEKGGSPTIWQSSNCGHFIVCHQEMFKHNQGRLFSLSSKN